MLPGPTKPNYLIYNTHIGSVCLLILSGLIVYNSVKYKIEFLSEKCREVCKTKSINTIKLDVYGFLI